MQNAIRASLLIMVLLGSLTWDGCGRGSIDDDRSFAARGVGEGIAPGFSLTGIDGQPVKLETYKGKVVLVDFWATWCGPCRMSIPHLVDLQRKYGDKGFQVIGISLDRTGAGTVGTFAQKLGINYPIGMGTPEVAKAYGGVRSIPQAFLIDRSSNLRDQIVGYRPMVELEQKIVELL